MTRSVDVEKAKAAIYQMRYPEGHVQVRGSGYTAEMREAYRQAQSDAKDALDALPSCPGPAADADHQAECEEFGKIGERDGYEKAVQDIDLLTGGDGEYCVCTLGGDRHCTDAETMKVRIVERFEALSTPGPAPVAWQRLSMSGSSTGVTDIAYFADTWRREGDRVEPLYRAAPPPVTVDAIAAVAEPFLDFIGAYDDPRSGSPSMPDTFRPTGATLGDYRRLRKAVEAGIMRSE